MNLLLVFDHRFQRRADGTIYSPKSYGHAFFAARYLRTFDSVTILARVTDAPSDDLGAEPTEGQRVWVVSLGDWQGPLALVRSFGRIRRELGEHLRAADAVLLIAPGMLASLARVELVRRGRPYGVEVVGDPYDAMAPGSMRHPLRPLFRWVATRALRRTCAMAAAVSYVTREALQRRYPCPAYSAGVSDVVLPASSFAAAPRAFDRSPTRRTLVTVGTMAQLYKAQDVLIDAVGTCIRAGLDLELVLVGDGRYRTELAARATALGIAERVTFSGALPAGAAVRRVLDDADCFVLPSHQEGLPRAMVEAMARGLPCVGSTVGGIPELLPAEDLVPPGDAPALAAKLREVLGDDARLARMSARSLEVARHYREEVLDERRLAFCARLCEASAAVAAPETSGSARSRRLVTDAPHVAAVPAEHAVAADAPRATSTPSLRTNAIWAVVGNVGYAACQCAVLIVLAKLSSAEEVGRFALALAVTAPVMIAASLQLRVVQATDARGDYPFGAYLGVRLGATVLALATILGVALVAGYPRATVTLILLVALAKAFETVSDVVFGLLQQHEDLRRVALSMLAKGGLSVAAMAFGLHVTGSLFVATLLMALAWGAWLVLYDLRAARRLASIRPLLHGPTLGRLAWMALPMGLVAGLQSLMTNVPRYAIEAHGGARELGYFAVLAYLVVAGNQPMMAVWAASGPRLGKLFLTDRRAFRRLSYRTMLFAAAMGCGTVGGALLAGKPLLAILYTPDYAAHADVLVWLAVVAAVGYQASALCSSITAARRFPEQLYVAALTLAVSWIASRLLVPRFGLVGAAWALLAATAAQTACLLAIFERVTAARTPTRDELVRTSALAIRTAEPVTS
jgi:O-antigen/teichoic acid export membrane protein/glycosyltransferase involved in cell wall biosynthesis